jgi:hypothetical protein
MSTEIRQASNERGSTMVEFVMVVSLFWFPLFMGTLMVSFDLIMAVQVTQVCRDAGHMYSYGIDFSQPSYQTLLVDLAPVLKMTANGGNAVVILSTITYIGPSDCTSAGYQANTTSCPNMNQMVITRRIVVGNAALHTSAFGTPNPSEMDSSGNLTTKGYLTDSANRASPFLSVIPLNSGEFAYVSEMWATPPYFTSNANTLVSARSIF